MYNHISNHKIIPPKRTWISIKGRLARRKAKQKIAFYRNLSIAAGIIAILSITIGFSGQWDIPSDALSSDHLFQPIAMEDLPVIVNDPFYDYNKILIITKSPSNNNSEHSAKD